MKKLSYLFVMLLISACTSAAKPGSNTPTPIAQHPTPINDVRAMGLLGPVCEVTIHEYDAYQEDDKLVKGDEIENNRSQMKFNAKGLVTLDLWGGEYTYDANGKFVKGVSTKSKMRRDDKGRVVFYSQRNDDEDDAMFQNEFTYDNQGRIIKIDRQFWETTAHETFIYEGDNIYPSKRILKCFDEGTVIDSETEYKYTKFDDHGNWTECELSYRTTEGEEAGEDELTNVTHTKGNAIQVRNIKYY